jgi:hypothetical protein
MLYRPHFCCHCGEKIIRAKWTPLTSRRFCEFCAVEQKQHDLIPRGAAVLLLLFGAAGFASFLGASDSPGPGSLPSKVARLSNGRDQKPRGSRSLIEERNSVAAAENQAPASNSPRTKTEQRSTQSNSSTEAVYYCGATTKKGTPCTRRVKGPGRCWQHPSRAANNSPTR